MNVRCNFTSAVALLSVLSLAACDGIKGADESIDRVTRLTADQKARQKAAIRGEIHRVDRPYFGDAVIVERGATKGKPLPKTVEGARSFTLDGGRLSIQEFAVEISKQTDLVAQVKTRYLTPNGSLLTVPVGGSLKFKHEGSLSSALEKAAATLDVDWSYDGTAITFNRMVTRDYRVSLPTGTSSMETSIGGVRGGAGSVTMSRNVGDFSAWDELETLLTRAAPPPGAVTISRSAGRVSVFGPPSVQTQAARVVESFEKIYSARIGLEVAVFFVDAEKADDFGVSLNLASNTVNPSAALTGVGGILAGNGVATLSHKANTISFKALATDSSVVDYRIGSTIAQSGVISPIILGRSQEYVKGVTETITDGVRSTSVETNKIDSGVSIHALPRLIDNNKIQLSLTILQNDLVSLETFQTGTDFVQLPTIDQRAIQNDTVLAPGETLVLSGYEQENSSRSNSGTGRAGFLGLGGTVEGSKRKIKMVVMVRPAIIPRGS